MGTSIQTRQREQDDVLQRSEKFATFHLFCNIEQISQKGQALFPIFRCSGSSGPSQDA
jgi:hypothetical protein